MSASLTVQGVLGKDRYNRLTKAAKSIDIEPSALVLYSVMRIVTEVERDGSLTVRPLDAPHKSPAKKKGGR